MVGYIGYNSATYYRYALLDWKHLLEDKNLGGWITVDYKALEISQDDIDKFFQEAADKFIKNEL